MRFKSRYLLLVMLPIALTASCIRRQTADDLRYRITVVVETPDGLRTASAVYEVEAHSNNNPGMFGPDAWTGLGCDVTGQAIGPFPGTRLFALPTRPGYYPAIYHCNLITRYLQVPNGSGPDGAWRDTWENVSRSTRAVELEPDYFPTLVEVRDFNNPASAQVMHPTGGGERVVRAVLQVTRDRPSRGLEAVLPWLGDMPTVRTSSDGGLPFVVPSP